jgi:hypothetical protein
MQYGQVLKRAWEIKWRWKILWVLGFLAGLGSGWGGSGSSSSGYQFDSSDFERWPGWTFNRPFPEVWAAIGGLVLGLLCLGVIIVIALWVVSVIARGGLIAGVQQVEDKGATAFRTAWRVGAQRFWTLFGISVLTAIPMFILVILGLVALGAGIAASVGLFNVSDAAGGVSIAATVLCGVSVCCLLIPLALILDQIRIYAERAAILEGRNWTDSFARGWQVLKEHIGPTIVLWIIFFALGLLFAIVIGGGIAAITVPVAVAFGSGSFQPGPWIWAPIIIGGVLAFLVFALLRSLVETFTSATWTLAYRELTGWQPIAPAAEPEITAEL